MKFLLLSRSKMCLCGKAGLCPQILSFGLPVLASKAKTGRDRSKTSRTSSFKSEDGKTWCLAELCRWSGSGIRGARIWRSVRPPLWVETVPFVLLELLLSPDGSCTRQEKRKNNEAGMCVHMRCGKVFQTRFRPYLGPMFGKAALVKESRCFFAQALNLLLVEFFDEKGWAKREGKEGLNEAKKRRKNGKGQEEWARWRMRTKNTW